MNDNILRTQIDRYIDGDLSADELTTLLCDCESSNGDSWRQCALSLIEAQEIRTALQRLRGNDHVRVARPGGRPGNRSRVLMTVCTLLLVAAAFFSGRLSNGTVVSESSSIAGAPVQEPNTTGGEPEPASGDVNPVTVVGVARIHRSRGPGAVAPVIAGPEIDLARLLNRLPDVPDDVRRRAGNKGLKVRPVREVMSVELADGQRFAVPLDSIDVRYVGHSVL